jgi:hypothetical protein
MIRNDSGHEKFAIFRAEKSMACLPFRRAFYEKVDKIAMSAEDLCNEIDWNKYVFLPFGRDRAEEHFIWMIRLGILRREVDGQGLTSRVRLTPMGRRILSNLEGEIRRAGLREKIAENFRRHRRT